MGSSNICWGIDIGAGGIKGIKLEKDGSGGVRLLDYIIIPHKKVLSTPGLDEADALKISLGALMSQFRDALRGASIVVSAPGHSAFARFAKLPPVEPKQVPNLVKFEAAQQIPFPMDQVEWDYQVFSSNDTPDLEVGIFAITKERVGQKLNLYGDLGLNPNQLTLGPVAAYNAVAFDQQFTEKTPGTIILDIGTVASDLIVAEKGRVWVRTFPMGGHNFTEAINSTFNLESYTKADKLKGEAETSKFKQHIFSAIKPLLGDLVQDVQRSISYYQETHPESNLTRIIGVGSTFKLLGLRKLLAQQTRLEVVKLDRFARIGLEGPAGAEFEASTGNLVTAYGLALQGLGLAPISANLMPVHVIRDAMWKRKTPWFLTAAGLLLAASAVAFLRPFMEGTKTVRIAEDTTIQQVIRQGEGLKQAWERQSADNQPKFLAENVRRLLDGRDIFNFFLRDAGDMLASADKLAEGRSDSHRIAGHAFDVVSFKTEYLKPGTALTASPTASQGGSPPSAQDQSSQSGAGTETSGAVSTTVAGLQGAFRLTLVLDSQPVEEDRPFLNDSVLAWLTHNAKRAGVPYEIVNPPIVDHVKFVETPPRETPPGTPGTPGAAGSPRSGTGGPSPPRTGGTSGAGTAQSPDQLAPLPSPRPRLDPTKKSRQYTVEWTVQVLSPVAATPATPVANASAEESKS